MLARNTGEFIDVILATCFHEVNSCHCANHILLINIMFVKITHQNQNHEHSGSQAVGWTPCGGIRHRRWESGG